MNSQSSSFPYIITLSSLDVNQLEEWFDHLDLVFEKTPRDYFVNHWINDPWKDINGIQVALATNTLDNSKIIAATVRTFIRKIFLNGQTVAFGGVGEVSTKPTFRNRGLAKVLLHKSIAFMKTKQIVISGLHTSSSAPLYAGLGWQAKTRLFVHRTTDSILAFEIPESFRSSFKVRPSNLSNDNELSAVVQLQQKYSSHFNGTFVRDHDYWKNWILKEIGHGNHYVLEDTTATEHSIVAFILLDTKTRKFPETLLLVRDFAVNEDIFGKDRGKVALFGLLQHQVKSNKYTDVRYPAPLLEEWENTADTQVEVDTGTMYRVIESNYQVNENALSDVMASLDPHKHVFWDVDAF